MAKEIVYKSYEEFEAKVLPKYHNERKKEQIEKRRGDFGYQLANDLLKNIRDR